MKGKNDIINGNTVEPISMKEIIQGNMAENMDAAEKKNDLEVSGIQFCYGRREILKGTGFCARRGEVCLLLGANGAGKSTLLKCINGLLKPSAGSIKWLGKDTEPLSLREKAKV